MDSKVLHLAVGSMDDIDSTVITNIRLGYYNIFINTHYLKSNEKMRFKHSLSSASSGSQNQLLS